MSTYVPVRPSRQKHHRRAAGLGLMALWPVGTVVATAVWWAGHPDPSWWLVPVVGVLFAAMLGAALIGRRNDDRP